MTEIHSLDSAIVPSSLLLVALFLSGCCCPNLGEKSTPSKSANAEKKATKPEKPKEKKKVSAKPTPTTKSKTTPRAIPTDVKKFSSAKDAVEAAVFRIDLYEGKREMTYGTGFFVSDDGLMVTNYHVFSDVIVRKQTPYFTFQKGGEKQKVDYKVIRCMDSRDIDLCVIKLDHVPSAYLEVKKRDPKPGTKMFTVGNPKGKSFVRATGKVKSTHKDVRKEVKINDYTRNRNVEMIRMDAPKLKKGFSGGAVTDEKGHLIGVNSVILHPPKGSKKKAIYLAISSGELAKYLKKKTTFDLNAFTKKQIAKNPLLTTPADELTEKQIKKACKTLQKNECLAGIKAACADAKRKAECKRLRAYFREVAGLPGKKK